MNRFKSLLPLFAAASLIGAAPVSVSAAEDVIITVEVDAALDAFYKVQEFMTQMQGQEEEARTKAVAIEEQGNALVQEFQDLREQANSDILTEAARQEAYEDAQRKMQEIQAKENELRQFLTETQRQFNAQRQQQINLFYQEIADVVTEISQERSATLVIDVTARGGDGRASVIYTDGSYDITPEVITRINASKPQE